MFLFESLLRFSSSSLEHLASLHYLDQLKLLIVKQMHLFVLSHYDRFDEFESRLLNCFEGSLHSELTFLVLVNFLKMSRDACRIQQNGLAVLDRTLDTDVVLVQFKDMVDEQFF